jgi:hypothetical protein
MLVVSLSAVLMITLVNRFGVDTTAAFGAALQIWNYIQMPAFAVGTGISAMSAQNVGAGKWDRVTRIAGVGVLYSVLLTGSIVLLIELLDTRIFGLFLPAGSAALHIASHLNRIVTGSFIFFGISVALFGVVRATGAVMAPFVILTVSLLVVRFPARAGVSRQLPGGCSLVELPGVLGAFRDTRRALLPLRRLAPGAHDERRDALAAATSLPYCVFVPLTRGRRMLCSGPREEKLACKHAHSAAMAPPCRLWAWVAWA